MENNEKDIYFDISDDEFLRMSWRSLEESESEISLTVINPQRYINACRTVRDILKVCEFGENTIIKVYLDEILKTSLCFIIQSNMINVTNLKCFGEALSKANTLGIDETSEGFCIGISFEDIAIPVCKK